MSPVRVRFAPSPTGELHVGGLRTALFNYLYARQQGGQFVLRIEDTDQERYVEGAEQGIVEMLQWAGVAPDEGPHTGGPHGPYRQSERLEHYRAAAERLIAAGHAYKCYATAEELEQMRAEQAARGQDQKYDGRHRNLSDADRARFEAEGRSHVVRMRIPEQEEQIVVDDVVRGQVAFSTTQLDDQVLLKSDGFPTYHLAVVVDDHAMGITHVMRAEEWLPSTPKHILLYRWLELPLPRFAHLPLLLNDDRSKMSKRKGDVAAEAYRAKGYLPEALVNFLALLGWSPGDDRELFTLEELVQAFSLERITKSGAVFDRDKLNWMNQTYLGKLPPERLLALTAPYIAQGPYAGANPEFLARVLPIIQPPMVLLADVNQHLAIFFRDETAPVEPAVREGLATEEARTVLGDFRQRLADTEALDPETFHALTKQVQKATGIKGRGLFHPLRLAVTLSEHGPDLAQVATVFGKEKTLQRLEQALAGYPA